MTPHQLRIDVRVVWLERPWLGVLGHIARVFQLLKSLHYFHRQCNDFESLALGTF